MMILANAGADLVREEIEGLVSVGVACVTAAASIVVIVYGSKLAVRVFRSISGDGGGSNSYDWKASARATMRDNYSGRWDGREVQYDPQNREVRSGAAGNLAEQYNRGGPGR